MHLTCDINTPRGLFVGLYALLAGLSSSLGLAVGAMAPSGDAALVIGPSLMVVYMVLGVLNPSGVPRRASHPAHPNIESDGSKHILSMVRSVRDNLNGFGSMARQKSQSKPPQIEPGCSGRVRSLRDKLKGLESVARRTTSQSTSPCIQPEGSGRIRSMVWSLCNCVKGLGPVIRRTSQSTTPQIEQECSAHILSIRSRRDNLNGLGSLVRRTSQCKPPLIVPEYSGRIQSMVRSVRNSLNGLGSVASSKLAAFSKPPATAEKAAATAGTAAKDTIKFSDCVENCPLLLRPLKLLSPIKWSVESLMCSEFKGLEFKRDLRSAPRMGAVALVTSGDQALEALGLENQTTNACVSAMSRLLVSHILIAMVSMSITRPRHVNFDDISRRESEG